MKNNVTLIFVGNKEYQRIRSRNSNFYRLVTAYRKHAHKIAHINPISTSRPDQLDEFNLERYGLNPNETVTFEGIFNKPDRREGTVLEAVQFLNTIYCANVGFEFNHLEVSMTFICLEVNSLVVTMDAKRFKIHFIIYIEYH